MYYYFSANPLTENYSDIPREELIEKIYKFENEIEILKKDKLDLYDKLNNASDIIGKQNHYIEDSL